MITPNKYKIDKTKRKTPAWQRFLNLFRSSPNREQASACAHTHNTTPKNRSAATAREYYTYATNGQRIRKVTEDAGGNIISETRYLGSLEIERDGIGNITAQNLRLHSNGHATVTVRRPEGSATRLRYQLGNHLGSVALELGAAAAVLSYEEYLPYGGTALIAGTEQASVTPKTRRYSGEERDDTSGLCYYGMRYYAPWMGRWLNPDPAGTIDGLNLFGFVGGNPVTYKDYKGMVTTQSRKRQGLGPLPPPQPSKRQRSEGYGLSGRATDDADAVSYSQPSDKAYKENTFRIHWKGKFSSDATTGVNKTSGIIPYIKGDSTSRTWDKGHKKVRDEMVEQLRAIPGFKTKKWYAENSHLIAASFFGTNDILSAPPASVHQNTEWLAIEGGIKALIGKDSLKGKLRIKATGYVHADGEEIGKMKAARYKIYIKGTKVFDHIAYGYRSNIGKSDAQALRELVKGLDSSSAAVILSGHSATPKGIFGSAPTLNKIKNKTESIKSPMFTNVVDEDGKIHTDQEAFDYVETYYQE